MSFEFSKQVRGVLEVGSAAVGAEVLRSQVARFAMLQLQPIIEKFQSQGTQVVLEKIHEAGKSFWWDIALHMSKEISLESVHLAELGAILAVPLIARMSEYRVMKDVKIVFSLRKIALILIAVTPTYFELASTIQNYLHQYPTLQLPVDAGVFIAGILIGGEYLLSLFEIIGTAMMKNAEKRAVEDQRDSEIEAGKIALGSRQVRLNRIQERRSGVTAPEDKKVRSRVAVKAEEIAMRNQILWGRLMSTKSIQVTVIAGRRLKMSDLQIQRELIKRMNQNGGVEFVQMIQALNNIWDKHSQEFTF
ncbi:MAG: hypothetical protein AAB612_02825 [Patescibacteria group bacterium]